MKILLNNGAKEKVKKFYQLEWHDVYFKDIGISSTDLPSKRFYNKFYEKFFEKYNDFGDLDQVWVEYKIEIAERINALVKNKTNILSIGSGIGIVENALTKLNPNVRIVAIEPSENASKWVRGNSNISVVDGYFPECMDRELSFDFVYANNIDYVFDGGEYDRFLKSVVDYGVKDFLIITSANYNIWIFLKLFVKEILGAFGVIDKLANGQLWGYLRSKGEHIEALRKAGFINIQFTTLGTDTILIRAKS